MTRSERLKRYCVGKKKMWVAEEMLKIPANHLSYLLKIDIDKLMKRIDALPLNE